MTKFLDESDRAEYLEGMTVGLKERITRLEQENARLREALSIYADEEVWISRFFGGHTIKNTIPGPGRARAALEPTS